MSETDVEYIREMLEDMKKNIDELRHEIADNYVRKEEYAVVRNLVFGFASLVLVGFIAALVSLIIN